MTAPPIILVAGQPTSVPIQCNLRGFGTTPAVFNVDDILSCSVIPTGQTFAVCNPTIAWYTANSTQVGYLQGQVEASFSPANMALLTASVRYTLDVWRALSGAPDVLELIARCPLVIEPIAAP